MRHILAILLMLEGLSTGLWVTGLLPTLVVYDAVALALIALRALVGVLAFASGWWLLSRRPLGVVMARWALLLSAVLTTVEIGGRLAPSNLDPAFRWWYVTAHWVYAVAGTWWLTRAARTV
jgi:hypothetical protein